jgi:large subunit ribosomal protein L9
VKIILTQEVTGLGAPGDIVEVKGGYGRNYLLPQGFAIPWTRGAERQIVTIKRAQSAREIRDLGHANEVKATLENLSVKLAVRAGEGGRLYGSVTPADVAAAVKRAGGPDLDKRRLELPGHVKSTGDYRVQIRLHPEVSAAFTLTVVAEK